VAVVVAEAENIMFLALAALAAPIQVTAEVTVVLEAVAARQAVQVTTTLVAPVALEVMRGMAAQEEIQVHQHLTLAFLATVALEVVPQVDITVLEVLALQAVVAWVFWDRAQAALAEQVAQIRPLVQRRLAKGVLVEQMDKLDRFTP
jgi:hypothetical protein